MPFFKPATHLNLRQIRVPKKSHHMGRKLGFLRSSRDKVFKSGPSKICGRQSLTFTWSTLEYLDSVVSDFSDFLNKVKRSLVMKINVVFSLRKVMIAQNLPQRAPNVLN